MRGFKFGWCLRGVERAAGSHLYILCKGGEKYGDRRDVHLVVAAEKSGSVPSVPGFLRFPVRVDQGLGNSYLASSKTKFMGAASEYPELLSKRNVFPWLANGTY